MAAAQNLVIFLNDLPRDEEVMFWPLDGPNSLTESKQKDNIPAAQFKALLFELGLLKLTQNSLRMVKNMENLPHILVSVDAPFDVQLNRVQRKNGDRSLNIIIRDKIERSGRRSRCEGNLGDLGKLDSRLLRRLRMKMNNAIRKNANLNTNSTKNNFFLSSSASLERSQDESTVE